MKTAVVVGCGESGKSVAENLTKLSDKIKIVGFCDLIVSRAENLSKIYGGEAFSDYIKMYDAISTDAVFICLPPYCSGSVTKETVLRGIPFMTEIPISLDLDEAESIISQIKDKSLLTSCRNELIYSNLMTVIKQFAAKNAVVHARAECVSAPPSMFWKRDDELSGGILLEKGLESLEILKSLFGNPAEYSAYSNRGYASGIADYNTDDSFVCTMRFNSGTSAELICGNYGGELNSDVKITLFAFGKRLEYTPDEIKIYGEVFDSGKTKKMRHSGEILPDEIAEDCLIYKANGINTAESTFVDALENEEEDKILSVYESGIETLRLALIIAHGEKDEKI